MTGAERVDRLRAEVVRRPVRFGYGGRIKPLPANGLGVEVVPEALARLSLIPPLALAV